MRWPRLLNWLSRARTEVRLPPPLLRQARPAWIGRAAHCRSLELLLEHLTPDQRAEIEERGAFHVVGSDTGRLYLIRLGDAFNIDEYGSDGNYAKTWCFRPQGRLPIGDSVLAQKVALETFEQEALHVANVGLRRGRL